MIVTNHEASHVEARSVVKDDVREGYFVILAMKNEDEKVYCLNDSSFLGVLHQAWEEYGFKQQELLWASRIAEHSRLDSECTADKYPMVHRREQVKTNCNKTDLIQFGSLGPFSLLNSSLFVQDTQTPGFSSKLESIHLGRKRS
ncbi:hypothetical protein VNO77_16080 [Canavalia gladiata]|uniref:Uncharacterized protein n=1 Tax=Canavalia gladiata TaxID=3824 RepID=A0AAN9M148_CANGL